VINGGVHIPATVNDHDSFRLWAHSDRFPERGQFFFLNGKFWVDLSMETLIHNQIKSVISIVVGSIVLNEGLGTYLADRMMLTHVAARLSCEPGAMFVSNASLADGLVTLAKGD